MKNILIYIGTSRKGSSTEKVGHYVDQQAQAFGLTTRIIHANDYVTESGVTIWGEKKAKEYREMVQQAGGYIICSPEYNRSFPGELKIILDAALEEYYDKPVGVCSVSSGPYGGMRMIQNILPVIDMFQMVHVKPNVAFSHVKEIWNDGTLREPERINTQLEEMFAQLQRRTQ